MTQNGSSPAKRRLAWSAVAASLVLVSTLAVSVPKAFAQPVDPQAAEVRRYFQIFENVYQFVLQNYVDEIEAKKLYEGAMKGMFESLGDPYSVFLDEAMMSDMNDTTEGKFGGIGLYISKQPLDPKAPEGAPRYIEIVSPIEDTPGWRAGFKPGDLIVKIEGESTAPLSTDEAQSKLRGEPGSKISVTVKRGNAELDFSVIRAVIEIPTVKHALIPAAKGKIAYLRIIEFTPATLPRVKEAIKDFDQAGYVAMIVDVRSNPGGLLDSVVKIADLFLDGGTIVSTKGRSAYENSIRAAKSDLAIPKDKPVALLLNRGSASASEILAGALKDQKRAFLVGENSYGKGSVQQPFPIDGTGFKLTMARYYTPSDENIDKTGIPPDLVAKDPDLGQAEAAALEKLFDSGRIPEFAKKKPQATQPERDAFAKSLIAEGFTLPERLMKRLVRDELARNDIAPTFDLEFDTALQAAIGVLEDPAYAKRLAETRTVKELVAEKKAATAAVKK
ncbi:MAG: S41 family peptidase [Spirochaetaceae bacterium]|nr:S41 family peptidase [Spirochaetaceae bacterium]